MVLYGIDGAEYELLKKVFHNLAEWYLDYTNETIILWLFAIAFQLLIKHKNDPHAVVYPLYINQDVTTESL